MIEPIDLLVSLLAIAGQWCMATRRRIGWLWFLATNVLLIAIACDLRRWGLIPGYLVLSAINVYGLAKWHAPVHSHPNTAISGDGLKESR
jgi:nicotinamide riboside transporter PnuC